MSLPHSRRQFLSRLAAAGTMPLLGACAAPDQPVATPASQPARTAMLLPLSGPQAQLGQTMAKAVWLVEDRSALRQRVEIFDTGPTPQGAAAAAKQADGAGAEVIIGPLYADHTAAVMQSAPKAQVITLSNDDRLAAAGAWVFGVTPAHSADAAAAFAKQQGAGTITLLQPAGDFGVLSGNAVSAAAKRHRLIPMPPVPMSETENLLDHIRAQTAGVLPDCLYLPMANADSRRAARLAEQAGMKIIGSLQWADISPGDLDGIKTMAFAGPDPQLFENLSASYRAQLGEEMGIISGLAVDAVVMANSLPRDRTGRIGMTGAAPVDGLLGKSAFRKDRTCARDLAILQIRGGQVRKVA